MEIRTFQASEVRVLGDGRTISGYAILYNMPSHDLGGFTEIITSGAARRTLSRNLITDPVKSYWNHSSGAILGSTDAKGQEGLLEIGEDTKGVWYRVRPPRTTWGEDALATVRAGLAGSSFGFSVPKKGEEWRGNKRILSDIDLFEVSPTPNPAYPGTIGQVVVRALGGLETYRLRHRINEKLARYGR